MKEFTHNFFGSEIKGRIPNVNDSIIPVSIIDAKTSDAWARVYNYDSMAGILEADDSKLDSLINFYQKRSFKGSSFGIGLLNGLIYVIKLMESLMKSFLGMFFGFGLMGIFIVIALAAASLMVSIYIFIIIAPLLLLVYLITWNMNRKTQKELGSLQQAILQQFTPPA